MRNLLLALLFCSPAAFSAAGDPLPPPLPPVKMETPAPSLPAPANKLVPVKTQDDAPCKIVAKKLGKVSKQGGEVLLGLSSGWRTCVQAIMSDDWLEFDRQASGLALRISPNPSTQERVGEILLQGKASSLRIEIIQEEGDYDLLENVPNE